MLIVVITAVENRRRIHSCPHEYLFVCLFLFSLQCQYIPHLSLVFGLRKQILTLRAPLISLFCVSSSPLSSVLLPVTWETISASHLENVSISDMHLKERVARREEAYWRSYERGCTGGSFEEVFLAPMTYKRHDTQLEYTNHAIQIMWEPLGWAVIKQRSNDATVSNIIFIWCCFKMILSKKVSFCLKLAHPSVLLPPPYLLHSYMRWEIPLLGLEERRWGKESNWGVRRGVSSVLISACCYRMDENRERPSCSSCKCLSVIKSLNTPILWGNVSRGGTTQPF